AAKPPFEFPRGFLTTRFGGLFMFMRSWLRSVARTFGFRTSSTRRQRRRDARVSQLRHRRLCLDRLEDRTVPTVLDLSSFAGQTGTIGGAILTGSTAHLVSGSGVLDSFVQLDKKGVEQGYNSDDSSDPLNGEGNTNTFNHSLQLSALANDVVIKD